MAHHDHQTPHECHVKSLLQNIYYKYIKDLFEKNNSITFEQECTLSSTGYQNFIIIIKNSTVLNNPEQ